MDRIAEYLSVLPTDAARTELTRCCGARRWVEQMLAALPFASDAAVLAAAEREWRSLERKDWLEAFARHPRIGDRATAGWSRDEQSGMNAAAAAVRARIAEGNRLYEEKFGHLFLICATGLTADEIVRELDRRLANPPEEELRNAAAEQAKITRLRLEKLVSR